MNPVVRVAATLAVTLGALLAPPVALAVDSGDIVVVSIKGEVHVNINGAPRTMRAGSVLELPAILRTGRDGAVELRQGTTTLSVGPETQLEFPALEKRGAPIDRIIQPRGNVFYNIGKREGRKLRIETPYLVGVVKGTQFNVAAQDETTTISLFEGLLEVRAADESGVVDLRAGEIASRARDDKGVNVIRMDSGKTPAAPSRKPAGSGTNNAPKPNPAPPRATPQTRDRDSVLVDRGVTDPVNSTAGVGVSVANTEPATGASGVEVVAPRVDAPAPDASAAVSVSSPVVDVSTSTTVDAGPASVDTGAAVSVSSPAVDLSTSTTVDAGPASVDTGAAVSVSSPAVDTAVTAGITAGPAITTDVDLGTAVDLGSGEAAGNTGLTVTVGASANQVEVTVGSERAAEAVAGTVNLGLEIAAGQNPGVDVGVDLGVELGLEDDSATTPSTDPVDTDKPGNGPPADVVELLDSLVRRPGRK